jgi:hypothetical protein
MHYGQDAMRRFYNIALGKICEATLLRFLRQHAIPHVSREGETPHTQPDRFDLRILNEIVDLKTFHIPEAQAKPERLVHCLALVPHDHGKDQWSKRRRYQRYLFGFFKGELRGRFATTAPDHATEAADPAADSPRNLEFVVSQSPSVLFLAAAPAIAECEKLFVKIKAGAICVQYPRGTRIENMGCKIEALPSFQSFLENMHKFRRR